VTDGDPPNLPDLEPAVGATSQRGGVVGLLRRHALDLRPLRHREYRLLWSGQAISFMGTQVTYVALGFQMFQLTRSSLAVGLIALCELVPLLTMSFVGGALADALDRRKLFFRTETALTLVPLLLFLNALRDDPMVWPLFVLAAFAAGLEGLGRPSLWAMLPRLVTKEELPAATALQSFYLNLGSVAGPAMGGLLIRLVGLPGVYLLDAVSFAASLLTLSLMKATPPPEDAERPSLRSVAEGFRYARSQPVLMATYVVDFNAMVFGMPTALFPELAHRYAGVHGSDPATVLGLLTAAPAVGALAGTLTSGWVRKVRRHGLAILSAIVVWGVAITVFGFAPSLWLALPMLALAGFGDFVSATFRSTIWNQTIPDAVRGRLAGIELANVASGPLLGNLEAGAMSRFFGPRFSIVSGGLACLAGTGLLALLLPQFLSYRSEYGGET
jgi:MFS family permease